MAAGAVLFAFQGGEYSTMDLWRQRQRKFRLQAETDSLVRELDSLRQVVKAVQTDRSTQERIAREEFGMSQIYLQPEARDAAYREDTLAKISQSWLFADQARFAELILTPLTPANAAWTFSTATALLHFSPEPRVIEKAIESAVMLGRDDQALLHLARYRAAFPKEHAQWAKDHAGRLNLR